MREAVAPDQDQSPAADRLYTSPPRKMSHMNQHPSQTAAQFASCLLINSLVIRLPSLLNFCAWNYKSALYE